LFDQDQRLAQPQQPPQQHPPKQQPVRVQGTRPTPPTNSADMSPEQRWQADQDARSRGDAWLDQSKVLTRDNLGNLVQRDKVIGADGEPTLAKPVDRPESEGGEQAAASEGEEKRITVGDTDFSEKEIRDALASKAEADLRRAAIPPTPAGYRLELPADFKPPVGFDFRVGSLEDAVRGPQLRAAMEGAHRNSLDQTQFSELLALHASTTAHETTMIANAARQERDLLGAAGPVRIDAVATWLKSNFGADAKAMLATMVTAKQVEVFEKIIMKVTRQGGSQFNAGGRIPPEMPTISDEAYNKMSYSQKIEYAQQATARANNNNGSRR
jgi:hypothetical protein